MLIRSKTEPVVYHTKVIFATDGSSLLQWSLEDYNWNDNENKLQSIIWKAKNKALMRTKKEVALSDAEEEAFAKKLHPVLQNFLLRYRLSQPIYLLYALKRAKPMQQYPYELFLKNGARAEVCLGLSFSYGDLDCSIDELIHIVRKKNKTYLTMQEMVVAINKIKANFPASTFTPKKIEILNHFLFYYQQNKNQHISRSELVQSWLCSYIRDYSLDNPFDILDGQRACCRIFKTKESASRAFFNKFLRGEEKLDTIIKRVTSTYQNRAKNFVPT